MDDWKKELQDINKHEQMYKEEQRLKAAADKAARDLNTAKAKEFIQNTIIPAFNELVTELKEYVEKAWWDGGDLDTDLRIQFKSGGVLYYSIILNTTSYDIAVQRKCKAVGPSGRPSYENASYDWANKRKQEQGLPAIAADCATKNDIIKDFMTEYKHYKSQEPHQ